MSSTVSTTIYTYPLNGSSREFTVPFEYLARRFVTVTLLGGDRTPLLLGEDFRFVSRGLIQTTRAYGPSQGFDRIEVKRNTSAAERLIDFADGSILRASELNLSQVQAVHVAEEARDRAEQGVGPDGLGSFDAIGRRVINIAPGIRPTDAVAYSQIKDVIDAASDSLRARDESQEIAIRFGDVNTAVEQTAHLKSLAEQAKAVAEAAAILTGEYRDAGEFAATRSEAARDIAFVNAETGTDYAAVRGAVADGEPFQIVLPDGLTVVRYIRNSATTQTEIARFPTANGVAAQIEGRTKGLDQTISLLGEGEGSTPVVADNLGNVALAIREDGAVVAGALESQSIELGQATVIEGWQSGSEFSPIQFAIVDNNDRVAFAVNDNGEVIYSGVPKRTAYTATIRREPVDERFDVDINHFVMNGQSLSIRGGTSVSVQDATDLLFSGGIHIDSGEVNNTFIPMSSNGTSSVLFNAMQQLKFMMKGSADYAKDSLYNDDYTLLASSHGFSGAAIAGLVKGGSTGSYENAIHAVREGARLARAAGKSYAVPALSWIQGESDRRRTVEEYKTDFLAMLDDYRTDISALSGQPNQFKVLTYQPSGQQYDLPQGTSVPNSIAQAYFELSEADPNIVIVTPTYWIEHQDALHPTAEGGLHFGLAWGKALYKAVYRSEGWRPLEPRRIDAYGPRVIVLRLNVPEPPLVFDTVSVTNPGNYGFEVRDGQGEVPITAVEIAGVDSVRITVSRDLAANALVSYAFYGVGGQGGGPLTGARGCLRDSDPTIGVNGFAKLWNWCVAFNKPVSYRRA